jgi:hypothetical protein
MDEICLPESIVTRVTVGDVCAIPNLPNAEPAANARPD